MANPPKNIYDESRYFKQVVNVFEDTPSEDTKRAYVSAVIKCFDENQGNPHAPKLIASDHGFNKNKLHTLRLVLAKNNAAEFFVTDVNWPAVNVRDIRKTMVTDYTTAFGRAPFKRGRSTYWFTLAEWIVLLNLNGAPPLPTEIKEFAIIQKLLPGE